MPISFLLTCTPTPHFPSPPILNFQTLHFVSSIYRSEGRAGNNTEASKPTFSIPTSCDTAISHYIIIIIIIMLLFKEIHFSGVSTAKHRTACEARSGVRSVGVTEEDKQHLQRTH